MYYIIEFGLLKGLLPLNQTKCVFNNHQEKNISIRTCFEKCIFLEIWLVINYYGHNLKYVLERLGKTLTEEKLTTEETIASEGITSTEVTTYTEEMKPKNNKLIIAVLITAIVAGAACFGIGRMTAVPAEVAVATVNGEAITKDELYDAMKGQYGQSALDQLISEKILESELKKANIVISEGDTQKELQEMIVQYGGQEQFDALLTNYGYSLEDFKTNIEMNLKLQKLLEPKITITEDEMKAYFDANKETFDVKEQVKASHILVDSEAKAKEVKEKLSAGGDFAALAKEYSIDTSNSEQGGALGFFSRGDMVPEFENVAFSLEAGTISDPVKTDFGYHIIKLEEKTTAKAAVYEETKDQLKDILFGEKLPTVYDTWIQEKFQEYEIKNLL
jgi:foldase protein PrsA